nr:aspartate/glutamate racemase family protein [Flavonifractor sp. An100]
MAFDLNLDGRRNEAMTAPLGILMLNTKFPRIPGDIGNPESFSFPVRKKAVENANPDSVVFHNSPALLEPFLAAAEELEREGVRAITTSCGFLAMYQKELAARVHIPVFTSSLLQVNMVSSLLPANQCVGIMTISANKLGERHFQGVGIAETKKVIWGLEGTHFYDVFTDRVSRFDRQQATRDMISQAQAMVREHPEVGAIIFECTNMPPYAGAVSQALGLPVYDILTLANYVMSGVFRSAYVDGHPGTSPGTGSVSPREATTVRSCI